MGREGAHNTHNFFSLVQMQGSLPKILLEETHAGFQHGRECPAGEPAQTSGMDMRGTWRHVLQFRNTEAKNNNSFTSEHMNNS